MTAGPESIIEREVHGVWHMLPDMLATTLEYAAQIIGWGVVALIVYALVIKPAVYPMQRRWRSLEEADRIKKSRMGTP